MRSNIEFKSNLYPFESLFAPDEKFLSQIHDIFALEILHRNLRNFKMSPLQYEEYRAAAVHCALANKDDYPWGTIVDGSGKPKVVCRCLNTRCKLFRKCRPDFDSSELEVLAANKAARAIITSELAAPVKNIPRPIPPPVAPAVPVSIQPKIELPPPEPIQIKPAARVKVFGHSFKEAAQAQIIRSAPSARIIVNGGPGTGKTHSLIEKIICMVENGTAPDKILVFCFSRAAVETVRARMPAGFSAVDVRTFDSFATYMLASQDIPTEGKSYGERIARAVSVLNDTPDILAAYSHGHVIVDEVQDLVGERAEMVIALLKILPDDCGFTLLGDLCQAIYDYLTPANSQKFYTRVFEQFPEILAYELTQNYRQEPALANLTAKYRADILNRDAEACRTSLKNLSQQIPNSAVKIREFSGEQVARYLEAGTLGILTRTNGQALSISSDLRGQGIPHVLQRSGRSDELGAWISRFFCGYKGETIGEGDFTGESDKWAALVDALEPKSRYEVSEILRGLVQNPRANPLFELEGCPSQVTVSNIHRAKGREFDSVILIDDVFAAGDDILENKVCYVGLTRARRNIERQGISAQYVRILNNENRRCFQAKRSARTSKLYLSRFEIGAGDADSASFGEDPAVQAFIRQELKVGDSLKLQKLPQNDRAFVQYEIIIEDPAYNVLGRTSRSFAADLERALMDILGLTNNLRVYHEVYPETFEGVYVDSIISCVSETARVPAATNFSGMKIWTGLSISGFAKVRRYGF